MQGLCFATNVPLILCRGPSSNVRSRSTHCSLAPEKSITSSTSVVNESKPSFRVLPENLPKSERPPSPPTHRSIPYIGFILEQALGISTEAHEKREKYGPIYDSNFFLGLRTFITDHQAIIDVMSDPELFTSGDAMDMVKNFFGSDSLIVSDGNVHKRNRSNVVPAFSPSLFPYYFHPVRRRVKRTWEKVLKEVAVNDSFRLQPVFPDCYISIIIELSTGLDMDGESSVRIRDLFGPIQNAIFSVRFGKAWKEGNAARDEVTVILGDLVRKTLSESRDTINRLREYGDDIVKQGVKNIRSGGMNVLLIAIALSPLKTEPGAVVDEAVVGEISRLLLTLWFGGYSTAAAVSTCAMLELGLNKDMFNELRAEQDAIVAAAGGNTEVTYEQTVSEMPLLDSFLMEMMRVRPPVSVMSRMLEKDIELCGYYVPKGRIVLCDFIAAQRDAKLFPDPHSIVLDRFLRKPGEPKPPSILSFGAPGSAHFCIGAALAKVMLKTMFSTLFREYTYTLKPGQRTDYVTVPDVVPASGVLLATFERRK